MKKKGEVSTPDDVFAKLKSRATVTEAGCWLMPSKRYPSVVVLGIRIQAHRFSWEHHHGRKMPGGCDACHTCDNPSCVNPLHIFPGTMKDNMEDASRKGRTERGERHHHAKLAEWQVVKIRDLHGAGWKTADIADAFNVSRSAASLIIRGKTWRHLG